MDGHSTKEDIGPEDRELDGDLNQEEDYGESDTGEEYGKPNPEKLSGMQYLIGNQTQHQAGIGA